MRKLASVLIVAVLIGLPLSSTAAVVMAAGDIQSTFGNGVAFRASNVGGKTYTMILSADGTAVRTADGSKDSEKGTWRASAAGYCSRWSNGSESCYSIKENKESFDVLNAIGNIVAHWTLLPSAPGGRTASVPAVGYSVAVPEGLSSKQIVACLTADNAGVNLQTSALSANQLNLCRQVSSRLTGTIAEVPPEGSLLADTYQFNGGDTRASVIDRMKSASAAAIVDIWSRRTANSPLQSPGELVTLASIIGAENPSAEERSRVAAVFVNRLRLNMPLQSDPTVIYALFKGAQSRDYSLSRSDLQLDSPYNTYVANGLPPGPIGNPGRASLEAAVNPARNNDLYFVADGRGGHIFAQTFDDHQRNIATLRAGAGTAQAPVAAASSAPSAPAALPSNAGPAASAPPPPSVDLETFAQAARSYLFTNCAKECVVQYRRGLYATVRAVYLGPSSSHAGLIVTYDVKNSSDFTPCAPAACLSAITEYGSDGKLNAQPIGTCGCRVDVLGTVTNGYFELKLSDYAFTYAVLDPRDRFYNRKRPAVPTASLQFEDLQLSAEVRCGPKEDGPPGGYDFRAKLPAGFVPTPSWMQVFFQSASVNAAKTCRDRAIDVGPATITLVWAPPNQAAFNVSRAATTDGKAWAVENLSDVKATKIVVQGASQAKPLIALATPANSATTSLNTGTADDSALYKDFQAEVDCNTEYGYVFWNTTQMTDVPILHIKLDQNSVKREAFVSGSDIISKMMRYIDQQARTYCSGQGIRAPAKSLFMVPRYAGSSDYIFAAYSVDSGKSWNDITDSLVTVLKEAIAREAAQRQLQAQIQEQQRQANIAAVAAAEAREQRRQKFAGQYRVDQFASPPQVAANPFIFASKTVAMPVRFVRMVSATEAIFAWSPDVFTNQMFYVTNVPATQFAAPNQLFLIAMKASGTRDTSALGGGTVTLPTGVFVGAFLCADRDCKDILD